VRKYNISSIPNDFLVNEEIQVQLFEAIQKIENKRCTKCIWRVSFIVAICFPTHKLSSTGMINFCSNMVCNAVSYDCPDVNFHKSVTYSPFHFVLWYQIFCRPMSKFTGNTK
jgi:hypothetical protein